MGIQEVIDRSRVQATEVENSLVRSVGVLINGASLTASEIRECGKSLKRASDMEIQEKLMKDSER